MEKNNEAKITEKGSARGKILSNEKDRQISDKINYLSSVISKFIIILLAFVFIIFDRRELTWLLLIVFAFESAIESLIKCIYYHTKEKIFQSVLWILLTASSCICFISLLVEGK